MFVVDNETHRINKNSVFDDPRVEFLVASFIVVEESNRPSPGPIQTIRSSTEIGRRDWQRKFGEVNQRERRPSATASTSGLQTELMAS